MTLQAADQFLDRLGWSLIDLLGPSELDQARRAVRGTKVRGRYLPIEYVRTSKLGGGNHPKHEPKALVPRSYLSAIADPAVLWVDEKIDAGNYAMIGDLLLVDYTIPPRASDAAFLFATSEDSAAIRWVRRGARCCYSLEYSGSLATLSWNRLEPGCLIARIHAIAKPPGDTFLRPAPPSAAN